MEAVTIVPTESFNNLMASINTLTTFVQQTASELKTLKEPYLDTQEVAVMLKFGEKWVQDNKEILGFKVVGGNLRFKRKDIEAFMEEGYVKPGRKFRKTR